MFLLVPYIVHSNYIRVYYSLSNLFSALILKDSFKRLFVLAYNRKTKPDAPIFYMSKNVLLLFLLVKLQINFLFASFFLFFFVFKIYIL